MNAVLRVKKAFGRGVLSLLSVCLLAGTMPAHGAVLVPKSYIIVINPGHASTSIKGKEPIAPSAAATKAKGVRGATGTTTKIPENVTVMSVGLALQKELEGRGYQVIMTKTAVEQALSNVERAKIGNENKADLVISLHGDSNASAEVRGASMLIPGKTMVDKDVFETSQAYGQTILDTYIAQTGMRSRGLIQRKDLVGFNWSTVPTVLIEMGFLSNPMEDTYVSNVANHPTIAKALADGIDLCMPCDGFRDVQNHWGKATIEEFVAKGFITGCTSKQFAPDAPMTRGEFVSALVKSCGIIGGSGRVFTDTKDHWAKESIDLAVTNGICNGTSESTFSPDGAITRQEAAVMVANYKKSKKSSGGQTSPFVDSEEIAPWARAAVESVAHEGYMAGYDDGTFRPKNQITRAEAVSMLHRLAA